MVDTSFFKNLNIQKHFPLWGSGKTSVVGVDIGLSSVKIVQLRSEKEHALLETYGELATGPYGGFSVGQSVQLVEGKAIEMLKDVIKEAGVNTKDAIVSIPLRSSFVTLMRIPYMTESEVNQVIPYEARKYIPVPINEVVLDWWMIPEGMEGEGPPPILQKEHSEESPDEAHQKFVSVLLVAIHKDTIEKYKSIMQAAGLRVRSFEIEVFSIARSLVARELAPILLLDFGASSTKITVVDYGIIRFAHNIDKGSQDLSLTLSRSLGIDFTRAEEMKREIGFSSRPEHREVKGVIEPILEHIFSNATRAMQAYQRKYGRSVNRVFLVGGGSKLAGLVEYAVKKFGVEAAIGDPFHRVQYPVFLRPVLKDIGPSFAQAIGLAIREL